MLNRSTNGNMEEWIGEIDTQRDAAHTYHHYRERLLSLVMPSGRLLSVMRRASWPCHVTPKRGRWCLMEGRKMRVR